MAGATRNPNRGATPISRDYEEVHNDVVDDLQRIAPDRVVGGRAQLAVDDGTATAVEMFGAIRYRIAGIEYFQVPTAGITLPGTDDVTATKFGAWRFEIDALGAITAVPAVPITSDQAFDTAQAALASLAGTAIATGKVPIGYLTIEAAAGGFTVGTDSPATADAQVTAATYYDVMGGSHVAVAGTLAVGGVPEDVNQGAVTVVRNGLKLAEIAADTTLDFLVADTIDASKFGGFLFCSDLAGTAVFALSADGNAAVSAQAYATQAAVQAALDAAEAALPELFVVVGSLIIENDASEWTANTDDLTDGSDVTTAVFRTTAAKTSDLQAGKLNP